MGPRSALQSPIGGRLLAACTSLGARQLRLQSCTVTRTALVQVMAKVSGERNLPPHTLEATTAAEAYPADLILPDEASEHTGVGYLVRALASPDNLAQMQGNASHAKRADAFVDHMLQTWSQRPGGGAQQGDGEDERGRPLCRWLALYSTVRKVAQVRAGVEIAADTFAGPGVGVLRLCDCKH